MEQREVYLSKFLIRDTGTLLYRVQYRIYYWYAKDTIFSLFRLYPSRVYVSVITSRLVNSDRLRKPGCVSKRRIGVQLYPMTAKRGLLKRKYGVVWGCLGLYGAELSLGTFKRERQGGPGSEHVSLAAAPTEGLRQAKPDGSKSLSQLMEEV